VKYKIYEGWIPDRLTDAFDTSFNFVLIEEDLEQPTLDAIEFFCPRMISGVAMIMYLSLVQGQIESPMNFSAIDLSAL
jgi:hypothetical protein